MREGFEQPPPYCRRVIENTHDQSKRTAIPIEQLPRCPHRTALAAIERGLKDLLRPTNVRDIYINACGRVPGCQLRKFPRPVRPSPRAGYGCSPDFLDAGDDWIELAHLIRKLGVKESLARLSPPSKPTGVSTPAAHDTTPATIEDIPD